MDRIDIVFPNPNSWCLSVIHDALKVTSVRLDSGSASSGQGRFLKKCGKFRL